MTFYPLCRSNAFYFYLFPLSGVLLSLPLCLLCLWTFSFKPFQHVIFCSWSKTKISVPVQCIYWCLHCLLVNPLIPPPPHKFLCSWLGLQFLTILVSIIVLWHSYVKLAFNCVAWTIELLWIYHRVFLGTCHLHSMPASLNLFPPTCSIFAANIPHLNSLPQLKMWSFCCITLMSQQLLSNRWSSHFRKEAMALR